jgi:DmsE family decaheme c-type cytochrome
MRSRVWVYGVALLGTGLLALAAARAPSSQPAAQYAGSDACKTCHEQQWAEFQKTAHGRVGQDGAVVADIVGCESCHGPGSLHVASGGDDTDPGFATIRKLDKLPPAQQSEVCQSCHKGGEQFYWKHGPHAKNDVSCLNCHSIHHAQTPAGGPLLKKAEINELCAGCHRTKRLTLSRSSHMPLREGGMNCADCHNPHGTASPSNLRASTVNELCLKCHADKRGPMLWEHAPVRENCLNCHEPHGSNNGKSLASKLPYLCQRCHIGTRHPATLYDLNDLQSNRLLNRACTNCHSQIHGSNHPSGKYFLR